MFKLVLLSYFLMLNTFLDSWAIDNSYHVKPRSWNLQILRTYGCASGAIIYSNGNVSKFNPLAPGRPAGGDDDRLSLEDASALCRHIAPGSRLFQAALDRWERAGTISVGLKQVLDDLRHPSSGPAGGF